MFKTQIDELKLVLGQLHRDRAEAEIVAKDVAESHQAQTKVVADLQLVAINKLEKQNQDLVKQMSEQWLTLNTVSISFSPFCLILIISILIVAFFFN